jgi:hypothetical protein
MDDVGRAQAFISHDIHHPPNGNPRRGEEIFPTVSIFSKM